MDHIFLIITMLITHWVADYVCQSQYIGANKWNNPGLLFEHVFLYTCIILTVGVFILGNFHLPIDYLLKLFIFAGITGVCHFATDYYTSKWTHRLYEEKQYHNFFVVLGFDQLLHQLQLILTYYFLFV